MNHFSKFLGLGLGLALAASVALAQVAGVGGYGANYAGSAGTSLTLPLSVLNGGTGVTTATGSGSVVLSAGTLATTAGQTYTFPSTTATIARTDAAQTFTGVQTFGSGAGATLGVGVTPAATTGYSGLFVGAAPTGFTVMAGAGGNFGINFTYNSGWKYVGTGAATKLDLGETAAGDLTISIANSGTAGNAITWTTFVQTGPNGTKFAQAGTTASAANAFLDNTNSNLLLRSTSSVRYKTNITYFDATQSGAILDALKPILYTSRAVADDKTTQHYGLLAEDVAKIDARLVNWMPVAQLNMQAAAPDGYTSISDYIAKNTSNGNVPDNVQYDRIVPLLIAEVKSLRARVSVLEAAQLIH